MEQRLVSRNMMFPTDFAGYESCSLHFEINFSTSFSATFLASETDRCGEVMVFTVSLLSRLIPFQLVPGITHSCSPPRWHYLWKCWSCRLCLFVLIFWFGRHACNFASHIQAVPSNSQTLRLRILPSTLRCDLWRPSLDFGGTSF